MLPRSLSVDVPVRCYHCMLSLTVTALDAHVCTRVCPPVPPPIEGKTKEARQWGTRETSMKVLVFGAKGWLAQGWAAALRERGHEVVAAVARAHDRQAVVAELDRHEPTHVVAALGRTHGPGVPTIDYLEDRLPLNLQDNLLAPVVLATVCDKRGVHFTYLGTGCIFSNTDAWTNGANADQPLPAGVKEADAPTFFGSAYSCVKGITDRYMHECNPDVLNLRIRMPITFEAHPRNFITKIMKYSQIHSVPNSMSVMPTLWPVVVTLMERRAGGTVNLVNPGAISHLDILQLVQVHVPDLTFTLAEAAELPIQAKRSNNVLDTSRLEREFPSVPAIGEAVQRAVDAIFVKPQ